MTWFCKIRGFPAKKKPFVFKGRRFGLANFSKFILAQNQGNQWVAREKTWIRYFLDFAASPAGQFIFGDRKTG